MACMMTTTPPPHPTLSSATERRDPARFVNVRFSLRFVMVSVSDPIPDDDSEEMAAAVEEDPEMTLSFALADVDIM